MIQSVSLRRGLRLLLFEGLKEALHPYSPFVFVIRYFLSLILFKILYLIFILTVLLQRTVISTHPDPLSLLPIRRSLI